MKELADMLVSGTSAEMRCLVRTEGITSYLNLLKYRHKNIVAGNSSKTMLGSLKRCSIY